MMIQPYLFFEGRCEEAITFYRDVIGAQVIFMMRFKDAPPQSAIGTPPPGEKIMHASLMIGQTTIMVSDGHCADSAKFEGFSLSLTVPDQTAAERAFAALSEGGKVRMPLSPTFFSPSFGMLSDKFGVGWMVIVPGEIESQ